MYNVQYGDAYLINENNVNLLVDFGSYNPSIINKRIVSDISSRFKEHENYVLISHFHKDHFNFIQHLPNNSVDVLYMRNIYTKHSLFITFLALCLLSKHRSTFKEAYYKLSLINNINQKIRGHIRFVRRGDKLSIGNSLYDILSPYMNWEDEWFNKRFAINDNFSFSDLIDDISSISEQISNLLQLILSYQQLDDYTELNNNYQIDLRNLDKYIDAISTQDRHQVRDYLYNKLKLNSTKIFNLVRDYEHIVNLSFKSEDDNLLMLGDQAKTIMTKLPEIKKDYKYIKVPHHGTPPYFYNFSCSKGIFISNSLRTSRWKYDTRNDLLSVSHIYINDSNRRIVDKKHGNALVGTFKFIINF